VVLYATKCTERDLDWHDEKDLYRTAIQAYPRNAKAHHNLGTYLDENREEQEFHFRQAIKYHPRYTSAYVNLGVTLARLGREDEAAVAWRDGLDACRNHRLVNDGFDALARNLNLALKNMGRHQEAKLLVAEFSQFFQDRR